MVGYPGSGKTTIAQLVSKLTGAKHLWASQERKQRFHEAVYTPANSPRLYNELNQEALALLKDGHSVVYDTNFRYKRDRDLLRSIAEAAGADCRLIWVQVSRSLAHERAVEDSENKPTRLWGNMAESDFVRLADDMEEPTADEQPIIIKGADVTEETIRQALGL